ncbi:LPXTG cell wall anchor domain-containing protein [Microbacterium ureisolvens]|uniref:LPXTG cell wall anchor domain-containing protein n=1 Tax=Microbacterium TaxID=33882 RepID=UPI000D656C1D|nr:MULTISPECIES: LPXTG cell wall anchor domain-containing protein [Microbacterium]
MPHVADFPLRRAALAATLAAAAVFAAPAAANASTIYPPSGSCTASPTTTQAGGTIEFACAAETFSPDESVTITVTGENGAGTRIGMVRFAITTASSTASSAADGSLPGIDITLPSNASGTYNIAAVSATSAGGNAAVTITGADGLPSTGLDQGQTLGLWIGGGALLLAGAALAIVAAIRRRNNAR